MIHGKWLDILETPMGKLFLALLVFFVLFSFGQQFVAIYELNHEIAALERDKSRLADEDQEHKNILEAYKSQKFIERYARENLEMIYPDEVRMMEARSSEDIKETVGETDTILH